jgi:Spy/CpxP family protein refolding chaperone
MNTRTQLSRKLTLAVGGVAVAAVVAAAVPVAAQIRGALRGKRVLQQETAAETTPLQVLSELLSRLQLSDEQRQAVKGIIGAHKDELIAVATSEQASRAALRAAIRQAAPDTAEITAAAGAVAQADTQLSLQRAAIFSEVWAVLTEAQRQELVAFAADVKARILERLATLGGEADPARLLSQAGNRLGLTDGQKAQVKEILAGRKTELAAILGAEVVARGGLNAAIHKPAVDEAAVRRACLAVAAADLRLDLERGRIFAQVWTVLTPNQQSQLTDLLAAAEARIAARVESLLNVFRLLF